MSRKLYDEFPSPLQRIEQVANLSPPGFRMKTRLPQEGLGLTTPNTPGRAQSLASEIKMRVAAQ